MDYKLQARNCQKAGCGKLFSVLEKSPQRYCCREHDPAPQSPLQAIREKQRRSSGQVKAKMKELCQEAKANNWSRKEAVIEGKKRGLTTPSGLPLSVSYLNNFMHFHGFSNKRPVKVNRRPRRTNYANPDEEYRDE